LAGCVAGAGCRAQAANARLAPIAVRETARAEETRIAMGWMREGCGGYGGTDVQNP
jgi:hypothetical protein